MWPRAKHIFGALGIDVSGKVTVTPSMIQSKCCQATVEVEEYEDGNGNPKKRNAVAYRGYERDEGPEQPPF